MGCVLVYRYTKERNINELRQDSMYGCENNRNSPVYRYTRTAPKNRVMLIILCWFNKLGTVFASKQSMWLDLSQLFVRESCHTYSSFIKIMDKQSVQDFHALVRYLNQFPPGEFLPTMSNFHLLVFLATSDMLPLEVMFMCWLRACDEITADKLQSDTLQPKSGFGTKLMNSKERLLIVLKKNPGLGC